MSNSLAQRYVASGWQYSFRDENVNEYLHKAGCMTSTLHAAEEESVFLLIKVYILQSFKYLLIPDVYLIFI